MGRFSLPDKAPSALNSRATIVVLKYVGKAQVRLFRLTNGRIGSKWRVGAGFRKPVATLLLEHVGRKSGKGFTTPLLYLPDGDNLVIVASSGGMAKDPQWYRNLLANPATVVHLKGERGRLVRARTASPDERTALWPRLVAIYADFATYAVWTDREIPVIILEPRPAAT